MVQFRIPRAEPGGLNRPKRPPQQRTILDDDGWPRFSGRPFAARRALPWPTLARIRPGRRRHRFAQEPDPVERQIRVGVLQGLPHLCVQ
jgi:hypothetical protein